MQEVWESTQENLENAVGTAYSGWTRVYYQYIVPCNQTVTSCFGACCGRRKNRSNIRRDSFDIFFDMYDDDDVFGRDELERLLNEEDDGQRNENDNDNDEEYNDDQFPIIPSGNEAYGKVKSIFYSIFPSLHNYKPSTADLVGVRTRSSTKSSTQSSETYRSRRDLFSDDEDFSQQEDAHMVSDADLSKVNNSFSRSFSSSSL